MPYTNQLPETGFVRLPTILKVIPISKSAWWDGIKAGRYPQAVKLGARTTAWRAGDIHALIESLSKPLISESTIKNSPHPFCEKDVCHE